MIVSQITAISKNRVIGKNNKLPWHLPEDLKYFREKTKNHILIMGRKTFESFPSPLPNRFHIVVTRNTDLNFKHEQVQIVPSLEKALELAQNLTAKWDDEVFVIGGGEIYKQSLAQTDRIYLTVIDQEFEGDTHYPESPSELFSLADQKDFTYPMPFSFQIWERKK
jgi:dihydrofolate reductase